MSRAARRSVARSPPPGTPAGAPGGSTEKARDSRVGTAGRAPRGNGACLWDGCTPSSRRFRQRSALVRWSSRSRRSPPRARVPARPGRRRHLPTPPDTMVFRPRRLGGTGGQPRPRGHGLGHVPRRRQRRASGCALIGDHLLTHRDQWRSRDRGEVDDMCRCCSTTAPIPALGSGTKCSRRPRCSLASAAGSITRLAGSACSTGSSSSSRCCPPRASSSA